MFLDHPDRHVCECVSVVSYIPSCVHIRPGYRENPADLQGKLKVPVQFFNRISRLHRPCNGN